MNNKQWIVRAVLIWAAIKAVVYVAGYVSAYMSAFVMAFVTGDSEVATAVGTWVGTVLAYAVDLMLFVLALWWMTATNNRRVDAEASAEC